jgi:F-box protein 45
MFLNQIYLSMRKFTVHRNPVAQSTDGARGKIGFKAGRHCWEVWWEGPLGTVAVIGLATKKASLHNLGYVSLLGGDDQSWGWNLVDNHLIHNGDSQGNYPTLNNAPTYQVWEIKIKWIPRKQMTQENTYRDDTIAIYCSLDRHCKTQSINIKPTSDD